MRLLTTFRYGFLGTAWFATSFMLVSGCGEDAGCTTIGCEDAAPVTAQNNNAGAGGVDENAGSFTGDPLPGGGGTSGIADGEACREVNISAQTSPVNVHILVDRSTSMLELADPAIPGVNRWDAVTAALRAFVNSPQALDARVGIQFFGLTDGNDDCSVEKYLTPAVPVAPLEGNRAALLAAIDGTRPGSLTPTGPALQGALAYARSVAQLPENAGVPTVLVLASDGQPSECMPLDENGNQIFSYTEIVETLTAFSQPPLDAAGVPSLPPVLTYIVATEALGQNAAVFARAGGGQAFLVGGATDAAGGATLEAKFLDALLSIVVKPLDCELDVPQTAPETGEAIDFDQVRVRFTGASSGVVTEFPRADGPGDCGVDNAWFYDNENPPQKIFFCRRACESLGAGDIKLELGCAPQLVLR